MLAIYSIKKEMYKWKKKKEKEPNKLSQIWVSLVTFPNMGKQKIIEMKKRKE